MKHRDGVLGRHRVIDRHRVQHPPLRQRPRRARRVEHRVEDPPRPPRGRQPGPHPHQHRVAEPTPVDVGDPARGPPAQIELERGHRLTIRQPEPTLQHHHRRHHPRRHAATAPRAEQIIEHPIRKQPAPLTGQHRKHRLSRQPLTHELRPHEQISLTPLHAHRHDTNLPRRPNNTHVTLPPPAQPGPEKNTSHLGDVAGRAARPWPERPVSAANKSGRHNADDDLYEVRPLQAHFDACRLERTGTALQCGGVEAPRVHAVVGRPAGGVHLGGLHSELLVAAGPGDAGQRVIGAVWGASFIG